MEYVIQRGDSLWSIARRYAKAMLEVARAYPKDDDMLALALPSRLLTPGRYEILVEGLAGDSAANSVYEPVTRVSFTSR